MSYHFLCKRGIRPARTEQFLVRFAFCERFGPTVEQKYENRTFIAEFEWFSCFAIHLNNHEISVFSNSSRNIYIRGARGVLPPLNFDNPKRSKIWYVACGTIIRRVAEAAKCESSAIDFCYIFKPFLDVL